EFYRGARVKSQQVCDLGDDGSGHHAVEFKAEEEVARLVMISVAVVKQRDERSRVDGDALFHGWFPSHTFQRYGPGRPSRSHTCQTGPFPLRTPMNAIFRLQVCR